MSQISSFFLPLVDGGGAQEELNAFLRGHRVIQIEKAFAGNGWAFCVEWLEGGSPAPSKQFYRNRIDYREVLQPEEFERFSALRERRKVIAQEDGVPPYMVMTDAQMAEAAKHDRLTVEDLGRIEGFGEARSKKYGERIIEAFGGMAWNVAPSVPDGEVKCNR